MLRPYDDAPRLPDGDRVDVRTLACGEWVELEVGPGRGWFLVERAQVEQRAALIGLEIRRKWASVVDGRLRERGLASRARVFAEDAGMALARLGPAASVKRVFVHFPDPWWKKRHQKRLLLSDRFIDQVARLLEPGGQFFVQTDVEERAQAYAQHVAADDRFVSDGDTPDSPCVSDNPYGARSPRERRAIADGLPVHRLRWVRSVLVLILAATLVWSKVAKAEARIVKGPYLTGLSDSSVDVRFELDLGSPATLAVVREDDAGGSPAVFSSRDSAGMHSVRATGLDAATRYAYTVRLGGSVVGGGHFTTAPGHDSSAPINFLVYGDDRSDPTAHAVVVRSMTQVPCDFLVNTGDVVEDGSSAADWQSFFEVEAQLLRNHPIFVAIGNHELFGDLAGANFARYLGFVDSAGAAHVYGTARFGFVRFFFLNAMHDWGSGEERDWLMHELVRADAEDGLVWRIAVTHDGPWSSGPHGGSERLNSAHVPELLAAHKVDLVLSGHDHIYVRGSAGGVKYIVSGGGGAPIYPIRSDDPTARRAEATYHFVEVNATPDTLRISARRPDGTVFDRCGFAKGRPWDCDPVVTPRSGSRPLEGPEEPRPSSRCGCRVPGAGPERDTFLGVAVFGLVALCVRRRFGRG
jgi:tRNA (guanine-N7-)-methyltransferase